MIDSDKPSRNYAEWLRQRVWPFTRRVSEGADSVLPHVEEYLENSRKLGKRQQNSEKPDREKPHH